MDKAKSGIRPMQWRSICVFLSKDVALDLNIANLKEIVDFHFIDVLNHLGT